MSNPIEQLFALLGDPQARNTAFRGALGLQPPTSYPGAVKSPAQGSVSPRVKNSPLLKFAASRGQDAVALGVQGGLEITPPTVEEPPSYIDSLIETESGGNFKAQNNEVGAGGSRGHFGRVQFGIARLQDAKNAGVLPPAMTPQQFMNDPELQKRAEAWHFSDLENRLGDLVGKEVNGKPMTMASLVAMGHLGGAGGARKYVETGGAYNPSDSFGTSLSDYATRHGEGGQPINDGVTSSGNSLSYGRESAMTDAALGPQNDNFSMGMDASEFERIKNQYGEKTAMQMLNNSDTSGALGSDYPDAIMRFLDQAQAPENAAMAQAEMLGQAVAPTVAPEVGSNLPYSMGAQASSAAAPTATTASTKSAPQSEEEDPGMTAVDRLLNTIYGTDVEDMTRDERADRRRAMGMALTQGFSMLSGNGPMDIQGIVGQRMELQAARRAAADLKQNAQGVSDMLVASGMDELAQLPFAGESGMTAAMNALVTRANAGPGDAPFDLPPAVRATVAQTMVDMGQGGLAEQIMNMPAGDALKELYQATLGVESTPPKGGEAAAYSPEQREQFATILEQSGNSVGASAVRAGASDKTIDDLMKAQSGVVTDTQGAQGVAAAQTAITQEEAATSAEQAATAYEAAGMPEEAAVMRAANDPTTAKAVIDAMATSKRQREETAAIQKRGQAVAAIIPDTLENAAELKEAARSALTSEDLNQVYEQIADDPKTTEEQHYELAKADPEFLPFLTELVRARAGADKPRTRNESAVIAEIDAAGKSFIDGKGARQRSVMDMTMLRQLASNPDFDTGKIQGNVLIPVQSWLNSILGESAPDLASEASLTGARLMEIVTASTFVAASQGLSGAISDRETAFFAATSPNITDSNLQLLAVAQYHVNIAKIQEAEYNAMLEWTSEAEKTGKLGDRRDMINYIEDKVGDMEIFEKVNIDELDDWATSPERQVGEVVIVYDPITGAERYESFTLGKN